MAAVTSWSSRTRIAAAPTALRLRLDDEATLRYVFSDWEAACGVRSNHGAQVEALTNGVFREAVHQTSSERQRRREGAAKVPLAERNWSTVTAKPTKSGGAGFPLRTELVQGSASRYDDPRTVRVTIAPPEEWSLLPNRIAGPSGPVKRSGVLAMYRALQSLEAHGAGGARTMVVLYRLYGPRDPGADYLTFGDVAPIVHMTPRAAELAARATAAMREARAEGHASALEPAALQAERLAILDRATIGDNVVRGGRRLDAETVARLRARLLELDGIEANRDRFERRAETDRSVVEPRPALEEALRTRSGAEKRFLRDEVTAQASQLRTRAHNALRSALGREARS